MPNRLVGQSADIRVAAGDRTKIVGLYRDDFGRNEFSTVRIEAVDPGRYVIPVYPTTVNGDLILEKSSVAQIVVDVVEVEQ